jgi:hypothetical protein
MGGFILNILKKLNGLKFIFPLAINVELTNAIGRGEILCLAR